MTISPLSVQREDATTTSPSTKINTADPLANKDVFLKLLVSQIQNQNPLNPSDPVQFLSQLTQFSSLEQTIGMRQALDSVKADLDQIAASKTQI
jgi:flagellar basal-body rod modification protein FlgD